MADEKKYLRQILTESRVRLLPERAAALSKQVQKRLIERAKTVKLGDPADLASTRETLDKALQSH